MKILNKTMKVIAITLVVLSQFIIRPVPKVYAATSPDLGAAASYSVLGGETVTNTGTTTISGDLGVSPGSAVTGGPTVGGVIHYGDSSAANAQLANTAAFLALSAAPNATCDTDYGGAKDLSGENLVAGVYCATAFTLTGTLTLSGTGVWIFRSAADIITSGTANVVGGDPCNVWWKAVSSVTLGTNTSLIGNILASTSITMATGASLNGRALAQTGSVTMDSNTITGLACLTIVARELTQAGASFGYCPPLASTIVAPYIVESRRVDADSIFLSWGPYSGTNLFNVKYGTSANNLIYSVNVTGFSTTLNNLPANTPIWVEVAARNDCTIGDYGPVRLIGGPGLPNTGLGGTKTMLFVAVGTLVGVSTLLFLIQRKHIFSSTR